MHHISGHPLALLQTKNHIRATLAFPRTLQPVAHQNLVASVELHTRTSRRQFVQTVVCWWLSFVCSCSLVGSLRASVSRRQKSKWSVTRSSPWSTNDQSTTDALVQSVLLHAKALWLNLTWKPWPCGRAEVDGDPCRFGGGCWRQLCPFRQSVCEPDAAALKTLVNQGIASWTCLDIGKLKVAVKSSGPN